MSTINTKIDLNARGISAGEFIEKLKTQTPGQKSTNVSEKDSFEKLISDKIKSAETAVSAPELKISQHAQARLNSRGIELSGEDRVRLQEGIQKARDKGSRESLVLMDNAAFVVSVKNNTVITAVDRAQLKENVFTNIDSTIFI